MGKYLGPVKWLGGIALVMFGIALLFPAIRDSLFNEEARSAVLVQAVPFFGMFVGILLLFILLVIVVAMRFNGKLPYRAYRPVELTIIAGILVGVALLFQPLHFVGYKYGFLLVLASTIGFILWSHIVPRSAQHDAALPPITPVQHIIGMVVGIAIVAALTYSVATLNMPVEPYGVSRRVWASYTPERQADISAQVVSDFRNVELPFLLIFNLFPAIALYLLVREAAGMVTPHPAPATPRPAIIGST